MRFIRLCLQTDKNLSCNNDFALKNLVSITFIRLLLQTIDNLRNGLQTQAKVYATSVIRFTLEPCNFTLNTFQDSVFTYFKQEQKCECNYRLLKLFREINKAENHHLMFP